MGATKKEDSKDKEEDDTNVSEKTALVEQPEYGPHSFSALLLTLLISQVCHKNIEI